MYRQISTYHHNSSKLFSLFLENSAPFYITDYSGLEKRQLYLGKEVYTIGYFVERHLNQSSSSLQCRGALQTDPATISTVLDSRLVFKKNFYHIFVYSLFYVLHNFLLHDHHRHLICISGRKKYQWHQRIHEQSRSNVCVFCKGIIIHGFIVFKRIEKIYK